MAKPIVFFTGNLLKTTILMRRLYFHSKIPVDFVCFYKTLNNSMEVKHCDLAKIGDMLKQIFAIGCSDVIRAKSLRLSISLEISTFHVLLEKKKSEDCNIPGFKGKFQVSRSFAKHSLTVDWHWASAKVGT